MEEERVTSQKSKRKIKEKVTKDFVSLDNVKIKASTKRKRKKRKLNVKDFQCGVCGCSTFVKGKSNLRKSRHVFESQSKKVIKACNACGLKIRRREKKKLQGGGGNDYTKGGKINVNSESGDKASYLKEGKLFALQISELVDDEDAKKFYCPKYRRKPCRCLQTFLQLEKGDIDETKKRANLLLRYHKKSSELIATAECSTRSDEYDDFVLTNRDYLKTQLCLCELAVQKVLRYSNNYLYKVTSSGEGKRLSLQPTAGQQKLSEPVAGLVAKHREHCRDPACRGLVTSPDPELVQEWRDRALESQRSRRAVILEMAGAGAGCRALVQLVTGAGLSCIARTQARRDTV